MPHLTGARSARPRLAFALLATITATVFALLPHALASAAPAAGARLATAAATPSYGIWPDSTVPATPSTGDTNSVTLGLVFSSATDGQLRGVQYYAAGANRVATTGKVWNARGRKIASISFPATSSDGWKTALFSTPVTIRAGAKYTVGYRAPQGRYAMQTDVFANGATLSANDLTAHKGTFSYGTGRPTESWQGSHYFVDVLFASSTTSTTPEPSPTPTPEPSPTPAPAPTTGCVKPDASNTGATGTQTAYSGPSTITTNGTVVDGKSVSGDLWIQADNVTVKNSKISGGVYVTAGSFGTTVSHNTAQRVSVSSAQTVLVEFNNLGFSSTDGTHVTSDGGSMASNITMRNNYVHDPRPAAGEHFDGLQVRGVNGLTVFCNNYDFGAPDQEHFNSPVYLEGGANGGITGAVIDNNWLFGGAFGFMYGADNDGKTQLTNNHFGGDYVWGPDSTCYSPGSVPPVQSGNDLRGVPITPCHL